jgi:hypothetical protein
MMASVGMIFCSYSSLLFYSGVAASIILLFYNRHGFGCQILAGDFSELFGWSSGARRRLMLPGVGPGRVSQPTSQKPPDWYIAYALRGTNGKLIPDISYDVASNQC